MSGLEEEKGPMCNGCAVFFTSAEEQRAHYKTDFHLYNTKRRVAGLDPIDEELWEIRLEQIREMQGANTHVKGKSHIKSDKPKKSAGSKPSEADARQPRTVKSAVSDPILDETYSLFDGTKHETIEDNVLYMSKKFGFFIPDIEYLSDLSGLLQLLAAKLQEGHVCIYCDKQFGSLQGVRGHMLDSNHSRIGTHTDELLDDIEDYYTYPDSDDEKPTLQEDGTLRLVNGSVAVSREFAYIYKQKLRNRPAGAFDRPSILDIRQKYLTILGSGDIGGVNGNSLPTYTLKRMAKRVFKDQQRAKDMTIRTEMKRHRTSTMLNMRPQIVEMYSFGK